MIFSDTEKTNNIKKGTIFKTSQHRTQIMKAKYFCILAYKLETDYKGLSHRQKVWPNNGAIHRRANQPGLTELTLCYRLRNEIFANLCKMAID